MPLGILPGRRLSALQRLGAAGPAEAIRQLGNDLPRGTAVYVHLTLMPYIPAAGELKIPRYEVRSIETDKPVTVLRERAKKEGAQ